MHAFDVLEILTTDAFASWFSAQDDALVEDVATALDVIERLGPEKAPPESRESLLWYEHSSVSSLQRGPRLWSLASQLEAWGAFRDYVVKVLAQLESERFMSRVAGLDDKNAAVVVDAIKRIKRAADPRSLWALRLAGSARPKPNDVLDEVRSAFFAALEAAGFSVTDVPAHSLALREFSRRATSPGASAFRLLYGVHTARGVALVIVGERLDRNFYGDSVRLAEKAWKQFLDGELRDVRGDVR